MIHMNYKRTKEDDFADYLIDKFGGSSASYRLFFIRVARSRITRGDVSNIVEMSKRSNIKTPLAYFIKSIKSHPSFY